MDSVALLAAPSEWSLCRASRGCLCQPTLRPWGRAARLAWCPAGSWALLVSVQGLMAQLSGF